MFGNSADLSYSVIECLMTATKTEVLLPATRRRCCYCRMSHLLSRLVEIKSQVSLLQSSYLVGEHIATSRLDAPVLKHIFFLDSMT